MKPTLIVIKRMALPGRRLGSALMRGDQLAALIRPHLSDICAVRTLPFHAGLMSPSTLSRLIRQPAKGSVVVFVKSAARDLTSEHVEGLRQKGLTVGLDVVDMPLAEIDTALFDFFVSASIAGQAALRAELARKEDKRPVFLVHHHADPRLEDVIRDTGPTFRCAYLGMPENAMIPRALADKVTFLHAKTGRDFAKILPRLGGFPLHFAVRPSLGDAAERGFKPFTKGFTAAACGAAILVNRDADDAEQMLGNDYPFFVDATTDEGIATAFETASSAFNGPVWDEALARVRALNAYCAPRAIADQVREMMISLVEHPVQRKQELKGT